MYVHEAVDTYANMEEVLGPHCQQLVDLQTKAHMTVNVEENDDEQLQWDSNDCKADSHDKEKIQWIPVNFVPRWKKASYTRQLRICHSVEGMLSMSKSLTLNLLRGLPLSQKSATLSFNTEHEKVKFPSQSGNNNVTLTDDLTVDKITYHKQWERKLQLELADDCGLSTSAKSMTTIISMFENYRHQENNCSKLWEKIAWKQGGLILGKCTHGVVHCMKIMLTYENPRDIVDLLKSLKYPPNITICVISQQVIDQRNTSEIIGEICMKVRRLNIGHVHSQSCSLYEIHTRIGKP